VDKVTRGTFLRMLAAAASGLPGAARADAPETIAVGGIQLPTNAPLYIAMETGLFARENLKIDLRWFTAAASVSSAVVSRDIDIGMTATTAAAFNLAAKGGFRIIAGTTRDAPHFPLNAVLLSNKAFAGGVTSFAKMGGHRAAMTTAGSTHQYDIGQLAIKYGVPLASIALVPLNDYGNIVAALQTGQVDAAILPPAHTRRLVEAKAAHFLAWTGDEVPMQQGILFASPQTLSRKHDTVLRFMRAYVEGVRLYRDAFNQVDAQGNRIEGPRHAEFIPIIARFAGITPEEARAQLTYIVPGARPDEDDIRRQAAFWQEQGMVPKTADFSALFDLSFLPGQPA
jgi:NitT/TauT family transport system substrate-binding protein